MARTINQVMTHDPRTVGPSDSLLEAARLMREADTGAIIVVESNAPVSEVATTSTITVTPDQTAAEAAQLMREHDIRRIVVLHDGRPAGIVSIGDLAVELDEGSALADLSAAPPNN